MSEPLLLTRPVSGFRLFRLGDGELLSQYADQAWPSEPNVPFAAGCKDGIFAWPTAVNPTPHRAPGPDCTCGIHVRYSLADLDAYSSDDQTYVTGAVACWGRIVPHPDAFRAELAIPVALHDPLGRMGAASVALQLGIPLVTDRAWLQAEADLYGESIAHLAPAALDADRAATIVAEHMKRRGARHDAPRKEDT